MLLSDLTPELILCILECCHASQIVAIQSLNHSWQSFVNQHEGSIFRRCAVLHGFSRESDSLDAAKARDYGSDWLGDVSSWRNFCKENLLLASRWRFESVPANARLVMHHHGFAHRAKIDEDDGLLLYTSSKGGLDVRDSKTLEPLGQFPRVSLISRDASKAYYSLPNREQCEHSPISNMGAASLSLIVYSTLMKSGSNAQFRITTLSIVARRAFKKRCKSILRDPLRNISPIPSYTTLRPLGPIVSYSPNYS
ncbi:hypothetical protein DL93DRAFT_1637656 [Clavulina sp. PMI_390]|nr:hypothetical protein DL93DRAFT_1637656 [Clavulina sp. PMI_390]